MSAARSQAKDDLAGEDVIHIAALSSRGFVGLLTAYDRRVQARRSRLARRTTRASVQGRGRANGAQGVWRER